MSSSQENIIRFPISSISNIFQQRRNCMWIIIIIIELCLGLAQVFTPYYVLPILLASILFMVMLINPEVSYYIMVISSVVLAPFAVNIYYSKYLTEQIYLPNLIIFSSFQFLSSGQEISSAVASGHGYGLVLYFLEVRSLADS